MKLPPVFLLTGEYPPRVGGIADYTARLADSLRGTDLDVTVLIGRDHSLNPLHSRDDVPVEQLGASVSSWRLLPALARRLGEAPAILHIQYQTAAFGMHPAITMLPSWLKWRCPDARVVVTCHDVRVPYLFPKAGPVRELVTHRLIDSCHAAIFSDPGDRAWAGGRPHHALIPIGSGVPVVECASSDDPPGWPSGDDFTVGYFGFMNASKGMSTLLQAVAKLVRDGRRLRLVLIGDALGDADVTNTQTRLAVDQEIRDLGLDSYLVRTGALTLAQVSNALMRSDVLAFPFDDGASFRRSSLMAALVHGRPVITTLQWSGKNGIRGFEHGSSVLLVPPQAPAALAQAIARVMDDPSLRSRLAQGALQASSDFQWPRIAEATRAVYLSIFDPSTTMRVLA